MWKNSITELFIFQLKKERKQNASQWHPNVTMEKSPAENHLHGAERGQHVGVVPHTAGHASPLRLTGPDKGYHLVPVHPVQLAGQGHGGQTPVHAVHAQVLCHDVFLKRERQTFMIIVCKIYFMIIKCKLVGLESRI